MTTEQTWLDVMPAIPLARGVPLWLMAPFKGARLAPVGRVDLYDASRFVWAAWGSGHAFPVTKDGPRPNEMVRVRLLPIGDDPAPIGVRLNMLRVDLDDPQGFGYACSRLGPEGVKALRLVLNEGRDSGYVNLNDAFDWIAYRIAGCIRPTDADRLALALALALAEVTL